MSTPKALVLRSAGTNCDAEMVRAFELAGASVEKIHVDALVSDPAKLDAFDVLGFPGGFSYGDDIAAGRVLASKVRERLAPKLRELAGRGVPMIGVCNGFQVMVQAGLLPKINGAGGSPTVALIDNIEGRFIDDWPAIEFPDSACVWTDGLDAPAPAMRFPIANGEGRFVSADDATIRALEDSKQVAVRYANEVNGSSNRIAGICDPTGRIFGLMPHPERYIEWRHHPAWTRLEKSVTKGETIGMQLFRNGVEAAKAVSA